MLPFPINTVSEVARSNVEMQLSIFMALSKSMLDTSSSLGRLNMQSGMKLIDDLATAFNEGLRIETANTTQPFMTERSRENVEGVQLRQPDSGSVAAAPVSNASLAFNIDEVKPSASPGNHEAAKSVEHAGSRHEHEIDPKPSQLVEKLVASVASDTDILDKP